MEMLNRLLLPPSADFLEMLPYLVVFMLLFHLPYIGITITSTVLSLITDRSDKKVSHHFAELVAESRGALLVFGIFPLLVITILFQKFYFGSTIPATEYMLKILPPAIAGLFLINFHGKTKNRPAGGLGVLLVTGAYFIYSSMFTLFLFPEKWETVNGLLPLFFSVKVLLHFIILLTVSGLLTGTYLMLIYLKFPDTKLPSESEEKNTLRVWGLFLIISTAITLPLLTVLDLVSSPVYSLSSIVYNSSIYGIIFLLITVSLAIIMVAGKHSKFIPCVFVLSVLFLGSVIVKDYGYMANANREHSSLLKMEADLAFNQFKSEREAFYVKYQELDPEMGKKIFEEKCSACHSFDKVVLGPAYRDVLPKYKDEPDKLKAFIKNPVKIDPNFPVMPNQGLSTMEVEAITKFLFDEQAKQEEK